jgi:hypothetical protein
MTLYDLIMGMKFGKSNWAALGRGEIVEEETIKRMLMEGYQAVADE